MQNKAQDKTQNKATEKKFLFIFIVIQSLFISFIFGLFTFSTYLNKKEIAKQISFQLESKLKNGPSRNTLETLSIAQIEHFNAVGYFNELNKTRFTFPVSKKSSYFSNRSFLDRILNGSIAIKIFFDEDKENLAGTIKYIYPRFSLAPFAFLFWFLGLVGSIFLFKHYKKIWLSSLEKEEVQERNRLISKIVEQVRHDLKSPIQTLFAVVDDADNISDRDKNSIHSAIDRIKGITGDLKDYLKGHTHNDNETKDAKSPILHFYSAIKQAIEEKKIAYKDKNIEFEINFDPSSLKRVACIEESDFLRVCSNLLLNAVESIEKKFSGQISGGKIHISLKEKRDNVVITFSDNGVGIPKEYIHKVKNEGFTYGKKNGTGLGLHYARQKVQEWQGSSHIKSKLGKWTQFEVAIPFERNIGLFESSLDLSRIEEVLIVDDDPSVLDRWMRKLQLFSISSPKVSYLNQPDMLSPATIAKIKEGKCLPLVDQEFRGSLKSGLSFIKSQSLVKESFLVTNSYCKLDLLDQAKKEGIRIIPKPIIEDLVIS